MFDRPCSKFVVMLLFRLYSCTFVNVYAVNGMSFTLFWGDEGKDVHFDVYIHHSFPLEYNVYSFIWSSVILKEKRTLWLHNLAWFLFLICYGKGQPLFVLELKHPLLVFLKCDSLKRRRKKTLCTKSEAAFSPLCYHGNFTGYDKNYFCTEECCILEQLLPCKQKQCKILSII